MNNDIKIKTDNFNFKYRVNGLIIKDNKLLTVQIMKNGFYCLPGGHVSLGENTKDAIIREIKEEVGCDVEIEKLLAVVENFFESNGKKTHELSFYYILKDLSNIKIEDFNKQEIEDGKITDLDFKWVSLDMINKEKFKPDFLKNKLNIKNFDFIHYIVK